MNRVFKWMTLGLGITAITSYLTCLFMPFLANAFTCIWIILALIELGLVWYFSSNLDNMSFSKALSIFCIYSGLTGFTLAPLFIIYSLGSVGLTFLATMLMFGITSLIGYNTDKDLSNMGRILIMCLIGLIIATIINLFVATSVLYWLITYAGIIIFVGLTAYDTQKIRKRLCREGDYDDNDNRKAPLMAALELYLDFINLFILLLRIVGGEK